jgi:hypothetical protein
MAPFENAPEDLSKTGGEANPAEKPAMLPEAPETLDVKIEEDLAKEGGSIEHQPSPGAEMTPESKESLTSEASTVNTAPEEPKTEAKTPSLWEKIKAGLGMGPKEEEK